MRNSRTTYTLFSVLLHALYVLHTQTSVSGGLIGSTGNKGRLLQALKIAEQVVEHSLLEGLGFKEALMGTFIVFISNCKTKIHVYIHHQRLPAIPHM